MASMLTEQCSYRAWNNYELYSVRVIKTNYLRMEAY
jgi:hypothetical protein